MNDPIYQSLRSGLFVLWEEVARDGARAKTLLTGSERVQLARAHGALFGKNGRDHLIFAAGFPAAGHLEFDAVRRVAAEVDNCVIASHGRSTRADVDLNLSVFRGVPHGRICLSVPVSDRTSYALTQRPASQALEASRAVIRHALDRSDNVAIDIALVDALRGDVDFVIDAANTLAEEGIGVVRFCDTVGACFPAQCSRFFQTVRERTPSTLMIGAHLHNDLGFGLMNNLEAIRAGVRLAATSWLGLGERTGLAATEQLLFLLTYSWDDLREYLQLESEKLWMTPPDLHGLGRIAETVSHMTGVPLKVTDPIVGSGVNSISSGIPFRDPTAFQPFDAESVLGVPPRVLLTQLASRRVVAEAAAKLGYHLDEQEVQTAFEWVKTQTFRRGTAVISDRDFAGFLARLTAPRTNGEFPHERPLLDATEPR